MSLIFDRFNAVPSYFVTAGPNSKIYCRFFCLKQCQLLWRETLAIQAARCFQPCAFYIITCNRPRLMIADTSLSRL